MVRMWLGFHRRSLTYTLCGVSLVVIGWTCANPAILGKFHFHFDSSPTATNDTVQSHYCSKRLQPPTLLGAVFGTCGSL